MTVHVSTLPGYESVIAGHVSMGIRYAPVACSWRAA